MLNLDFSSGNSRPSAARIVAAWNKAGRPDNFSVEYGETYAEFAKLAGWPEPRWDDSGNGCRGVDRLAVVKALKDFAAKRAAKFADLYR